jgi:alpha-L-fucosidase
MKFGVKKHVGFVVLAAVLSAAGLQAEFEPTWESLDQRETPQWYRDAKFGIFIHWGLYSVPAWSPRGTYAEWYWHSKDGLPRKHAAKVDRANQVREFHNRVYGEEVTYADFRDDFTAEMFDPGHWANVFKQSGAQYVVLTSKHHDGYCLWPSEEASESFGMPWNSVDSGPKRDLVGDLTTAVRAEGLKMGLYYSIWDWFNPYWPEIDQPFEGKPIQNQEGLDRYIHEVMYPQFKELVMDYEPALLFSDGDWWMNDDKWQTRPLLAWLFNNAPNKDEVIINDRWGKVRSKHGDYFTTEYGAGFEDENILWEENRGIGKSFGFNREETLKDYNSEKLLTFMLVDFVSRGGNFLLNIGPTADGRIPVIMEDRLARLGEWLAVNGEAIYGSRRWVVDSQWSDGKRIKYTKDDYHFGQPIFEMTIDPRPGQSVKELFFTRNGDTLYGITPGWPDGDKLIVEGVITVDGSTVSLLGSDADLCWKQEGDNIVVDISHVRVNDLPDCGQMYTFKFTGIVPAGN